MLPTPHNLKMLIIVVWAVTGLPFPSSSHFHGAALVLFWASGAITWVIWAVGIVLPVALAQPWGRRVPRWMLLWAAWTGCALLGARGIAGIADDVVRAIGLSRGLTGMTTAQVMSTAIAVPATPAYTPLRAVAGVFIQWSARMKSADATM